MNDFSPAGSRSSDPYLKKLRRRRLTVGAASLAALLAVIVSAALGVSHLSAKKSRPKPSQQEIVELWSKKDYSGVSSSCDAALEETPLDPFYLVFKGFSSFYIGLTEGDGEKRSAFMDEAVFAIRKALIDQRAPLRPEATYILGKAYFHKGVDYYNDSIAYLLESAELGYSRADTWEYLALAARGAGRIQESLGFFDKAMSSKAGSAELTLAAASAYQAAGDAGRTEALALEARAATDDEYLAERCDFLLGDVYRNTGRHDEALARYASIREKNPQSADAWYYEGLVLIETGDPIRARAAWRKAISIDPMHASARLKLSERL